MIKGGGYDKRKKGLGVSNDKATLALKKKAGELVGWGKQNRHIENARVGGRGREETCGRGRADIEKGAPCRLTPRLLRKVWGQVDL